MTPDLKTHSGESELYFPGINYPDLTAAVKSLLGNTSNLKVEMCVGTCLGNNYNCVVNFIFA